MSSWDTTISKIISKSRNKTSLSLFNFITKTKDYSCIMPNLYLGNVNASSDVEFLESHKIQAVVNCSKDIPYHSYFYEKSKYRIAVEDNKDPKNLDLFEEEVYEALKFIDLHINNDQAVLVHCYYGLMRSATLIACYLLIKYKMSIEDAIHFLQKKNGLTFHSSYNFEEIVLRIYNRYHPFFNK
jgi:protein-tyrosine phosphatase